MKGALGYLILFAGIAASVAIVYYFQTYLWAFIVFWLCLTIGAMLIMKYKPD